MNDRRIDAPIANQVRFGKFTRAKSGINQIAAMSPAPTVLVAPCVGSVVIVSVIAISVLSTIELVRRGARFITLD